MRAPVVINVVVNVVVNPAAGGQRQAEPDATNQKPGLLHEIHIVLFSKQSLVSTHVIQNRNAA
ncbi:MAG TPA: hypothetical protein PKC13_12400 [Blastocatellia bacterium]|nr:hypothetical protein [Blastocatellia bacterium]